MKLAVTVLTVIALLYWPMLAMFSMMAFDAPGTTDSRKIILLVLRLLFYDYGTGEVTVITGADSSSFEVTPYDSRHKSEARDRHAYYMEGKRVAAR